MHAPIGDLRLRQAKFPKPDPKSLLYLSDLSSHLTFFAFPNKDPQISNLGSKNHCMPLN